jgi:hypothetical protein
MSDIGCGDLGRVDICYVDIEYGGIVCVEIGYVGMMSYGDIGYVVCSIVLIKRLWP